MVNCRSNNIQEYSEISKMTCLPTLKVLVLSGNLLQFISNKFIVNAYCQGITEYLNCSEHYGRIALALSTCQP